MTLSCAQAGCSEDATHVCVQGHDLALLFRSGAGVLCGKHAADADAVGGCSLSLAAYVSALGTELTPYA